MLQDWEFKASRFKAKRWPIHPEFGSLCRGPYFQSSLSLQDGLPPTRLFYSLFHKHSLKVCCVPGCPGFVQESEVRAMERVWSVCVWWGGCASLSAEGHFSEIFFRNFEFITLISGNLILSSHRMLKDISKVLSADHQKNPK